MYIKIVLFQVL